MKNTIKKSWIEEKLTSQRWCHKGVYDFSIQSLRSPAPHFVSRPKDEIIWEFTPFTLLVIHVNGEESRTCNFRCTDRYLHIDARIGPRRIEVTATYIVKEEDDDLWLFMFDENRFYKLPRAIKLVPESQKDVIFKLKDEEE